MSSLRTLLSQCQSGDSRSQRALYEMFRPKVFGLCRRYTRRREEAEDVFQEAFIRIFKSIDQVHDAEHLEPWIRRITVNAAVSYYHKSKRHQIVHDIADYGTQHANDDYVLILSKFSDEQLVGMINTLPDGYRLVFNLYELEGYSHSEIADMLSISESTSRSQLNRAKQVLKGKLKAIGVEKYEKYA
ncbi:MAG: RNA polymerase sigma factor [Cyclobacteriaceae bacterium]|nr:RNA polymerase sigma factor [Cyclobacteriaceae bacterium]HLT73162.1 RNA polymerase sigma factor [Cyclobacteriaceae bacterium]